MHEDVQKVLITREQIAERVAQMGAQIAADYQGEPLLVVSVLKGAAIFMADLVRAIDAPVEIDQQYIDAAQEALDKLLASSGSADLLPESDMVVDGINSALVNAQHIIR